MMKKKETNTTRKTDRRTLYTRRVVKDALLELLETQSYERVTVAALCRQAEITQATFYLHYQDLDEVLNELLDEALQVVQAASNEMEIGERMKALRQVVATNDPEMLHRNEHLLSPCQQVADEPKYRIIFQDPTLSEYVIQRIYRMERDQAIPYCMEAGGLSMEVADELFLMLVYGLFFMNCKLKWTKDDKWYSQQLLVIRFMFAGLDALKER